MPIAVSLSELYNQLKFVVIARRLCDEAISTMDCHALAEPRARNDKLLSGKRFAC